MVEKSAKQEQKDLVHKYQIDPDCTKEEFIAVAKLYSREVINKHNLQASVGDLTWELSVRAKRRAGAVKRQNGQPYAISLTWDYFKQNGWPAIAATIRHELIHVHLINERSDASHGSEFKTLAKKLDTDVRCETFIEPKWWVVCSDCEIRIPRYQRSKLVKDTENYSCAKCGGSLNIVATD